MVVALLALFVALAGTAVAAGVVPHALLADNAKKLQGKTPAQVAALAPRVTSVSSLVSVQTAPFSLAASTTTGLATGTFSVACPAGKAISGGVSPNPFFVIPADTGMSADGKTFSILLVNFGGVAASGTVYAVCLA
jgi:hypothetical protein